MSTSRELFPWAVLAGGLYLALGRLKNLREGQGCPKCETGRPSQPLAWRPGRGGSCGKTTKHDKLGV
jgi:hypothetical protein